MLLRRFLVAVAALGTGFGLITAGAPAAHADTTIGEGVTVTVPSNLSTSPLGLIEVCVTVKELKIGPDCVTI